MIGPSVLGWVEIDQTIEVLALVGLAFLLFLAGLEIDFSRLRGRLLRLAALGWAASLALAVATGFVLSAAGLVQTPLLVAIILSATSLVARRPREPRHGAYLPGRTAAGARLAGTRRRGFVGDGKAAIAGLLQATSLPFIVAATAIGSELGAIDAAESSALVAAGLLSVLIFPLAA